MKLHFTTRVRGGKVLEQYREKKKAAEVGRRADFKAEVLCN